MNIKSISLTSLALAMALAIVPAAHAEPDLKKGKKVFKKCKACHSVGENAKNKLGPMLNDVFGRKAGGLESFTKYSKAFKAKNEEGLVWTEETMDTFLTKPKAYIKGTKMGFKGLKKEKQRINLIAYLKTFSKAEEKSE